MAVRRALARPPFKVTQSRAVVAALNRDRLSLHRRGI